VKSGTPAVEKGFRISCSCSCSAAGREAGLAGVAAGRGNVGAAVCGVGGEFLETGVDGGRTRLRCLCSNWPLEGLVLIGPAPFTGPGCGWAEPETTALSDENPQDTRQAANVAMERYAAGDEAAFADLYDVLAPRLHQFLARQTRDPSRADDLLQQTMLHIHRARGRFTPGAEVFPWAFAIARRLFIDTIRRGRNEVVADTGGGDAAYEPVAQGPPLDELLHSKRVAHAVARELAKIPEPHRVAFELVKTEGLSMREAAEVLGTTVTAVKLRAHRAYVALRAALTEAN
jgi:RNA polymerase sigma-70 factor (ECF subfamily)